MTVYTGIVLYALIWMLSLFVVLPWGVTRVSNPGAGQVHGAPERPRLWLKVGVTTLLSAVIFGIFYIVIANDWISFS